MPTASPSTAAARAVGHARSTFRRRARHSRTTALTVCVLPVPGAPVRTSSRPVASPHPSSDASAHSATASRWRGDRGMPPTADSSPPLDASAAAMPGGGRRLRTDAATLISSRTTGRRKTASPFPALFKAASPFPALFLGTGSMSTSPPLASAPIASSAISRASPVGSSRWSASSRAAAPRSCDLSR